MDTFTFTFEGREGKFAIPCEMWNLHSTRLCDIFPTNISTRYTHILLSSTVEGDKEIYGLDRILLEIYDASYDKSKIKLIYGSGVSVTIAKDGQGTKCGLYYSAFHDVGKVLRDHSVVYHGCAVTVNGQTCCKMYLKDKIYELCGNSREVLVSVSGPVVVG
ncbi:hypothetical protein LPJ77_000307 [Coemansia sp. RSA 2523]|nr:hypothetical protein LPJ58_000300 [Coemansia sp. RSA 1591]KAJ1767891.1 hypothetical protein LPJ69_000291 [Coemansia sp. RSA 1752]KAJ1811137.1 hypothetical protein LPJ77_000307 [Coemansia sp. RSA 2523]KAJ2193624.1 hypothetical protein IW144_004349 [Coemansia sp. RSA 522]KAJ2223225.1 hypothetical protein EV180_004054 [Coemansia sp. RSA 518]KAJ2251296.1 hypothetical protein GGH97_000096 [Coemansia sp. RSA 475]KAJ2406418.1 hypothetical protein J3F80_003478 [Coemansia sp. RSA 2526]KAJ2447532.1